MSVELEHLDLPEVSWPRLGSESSISSLAPPLPAQTHRVDKAQMEAVCGF